MTPMSRHYGTDYSDTSSRSESSRDSILSRETALTSHGPTSRPSLSYRDARSPTWQDYDELSSPACSFDPRASTETYASTIPSEDDLPESDPEYEVPEYKAELPDAEPVASTPPEFGQLFPSTRRLCIRHDDTSLDGNMNLRVDTEVPTSSGRKVDFTLFHLRMHDLRSREFSLRRYCRDSGREVCHSSRKHQPSSNKRPTLQKSVSDALASFRGKHDMHDAAAGGLKRHKSSHGPTHDDEPQLFNTSPSHSKRNSITVPTNTMRLEFSNYAQVDVKRRGTSSSKHYDFDYWGKTYTWKRTVRREGQFQEVSYHLVTDSGRSMAHIVPIPLTTLQSEEEDAKGGWIPPCSLWISDLSSLRGSSDLADVIVATGLVSLVDDSIKRRFHSKRSVQIVLPSPLKHSFKMDPTGPEKLIDRVFHRRASPSPQRGPTPLRQITAEA
ncbi:MAG: hypothetical protein M1817_006155 [Caeruleum heppii]|nr:MAG: hypothetical protein M1817_006155 [Caeruleum heppii]